MAKSKNTRKRTIRLNHHAPLLTSGPSLASSSQVRIENLTDDNRRIRRQAQEVQNPDRPSKKARTTEVQSESNGGDECYSHPPGLEQAFENLLRDEVVAVEDGSTTASGRAKRYRSSDQPLKEWSRFSQDYLMELLRLSGRMEFSTDTCPSCPESTTNVPKYRCRDCFHMDVLCLDCCIRQHRSTPLHVIEEWTGLSFERTSLKALGLRIQMGHAMGVQCPNPHPGHTDFVVVHTNGIHEVAVDFCACNNVGIAGSHRQQVLRREWLPATHLEPQTAFTFRVLEHFHLQTLQGKTSSYDYYAALEKLTNNTGLQPLKDRYPSFLRVMRIWRFLKMLKRAGRGHEEGGVAGSKEGDLAVRCPACPRPGINLPESWEEASKADRFLYYIFFALDACFRLKRRLVSNEAKDPGLFTGLAYFVEDSRYRSYLLTVTDQKEMSTCSGLSALDHANNKFSRGYGCTGAGLCLCARHEFIQPNGVGDLQKGERYANMDYIHASAGKHHHCRLCRVVSYDIVCQWCKHLAARLLELPEHVRPVAILYVVFYVVPKLHLLAHTLDCQKRYSLNCLPGAGRTDGEGVERPWAHLGPVATSTREMGPGSRHDTLDDHFGYWNWQKVVGLGALLLLRLRKAIEEGKVQREAFDSFSEQQSANIEEWTAMVEAWEDDSTAPNPYELPKSGLTQADVRLKLAEEEAEALSDGVPSVHEVSPSSFINAGLELEEQQRHIRLEVELKHSVTSKQKTDILEQRTKLAKQIAKFRTLQATYTPAALQVLALHDAQPNIPEDTSEAGARPDPNLVENIPLFLPSSLSQSQRETGCRHGLVEVEQRLREAQCRDSLDRLRTQLHMKSRLLTYKSGHVRHQGPNTRARALINRNEAKIRLHAEKYRWARKALVGLANGNEGDVGWRMLLAADVRCMEDAEELEKERKKREERAAAGLREVRGAREGYRQVSWIWLGTDTAGQEGVSNALRVEWTKARARAQRWEEERRLVREEMRRVHVTLSYEAAEWERRSRAVDMDDPQLKEGLVAYAQKQVDIRRQLSNKFGQMWTEENIAAAPAARRKTSDPTSPDDHDLEEDRNGADVLAEEEEEEEGAIEIEREDPPIDII